MNCTYCISLNAKQIESYQLIQLKLTEAHIEKLIIWSWSSQAVKTCSSKQAEPGNKERVIHVAYFSECSAITQDEGGEMETSFHT